MAGDVADPFLGLLAVGDVGVGPQHAAAFDRHAVDLDHAAVRALAVVRVRPVEDAAGADEFLHILRRVHELVGRPLVGQHRLERRLRRHQLGGQAEQVEGAPVAHLDDALGVDHHDALRHALERRFEQLRLLGQHRFAGARLLLGEDQALLLALQVADVDVDDEVHAVRAGALDDPDPAAMGQRQLERLAGVAQALRQRREPARERRRLAGRGVLPGRPIDVFEGRGRALRCGRRARTASRTARSRGRSGHRRRSPSRRRPRGRSPPRFRTVRGRGSRSAIRRCACRRRVALRLRGRSASRSGSGRRRAAATTRPTA